MSDGEGAGPKDKPDKAGKGRVQLEVRVDDAVAGGLYSNGLMVHTGETEFTLDFLHMEPGRASARVRARVIVSPRQAKRVLRLLGDNMRRYEQRFGPVEEAKPMPPKDPTVH